MCKVINDCALVAMQQLIDDGVQVDSIVTDPPYELGFMNKHWDGRGIAYNVALWKLALQLLKPGGHMLAFGGTRTIHRMVCAIEDAGFEIRDTISWIYGSGFPKSLNISKQLDKMAGAEREIIGKSQRHGGGTSHIFPGDINNPITAPATDLAKKWDGFGTALKPAVELIALCRKPLSEKNIASNVIKHGVGGLNIGATRIKQANDIVLPNSLMLATLSSVLADIGLSVRDSFSDILSLNLKSCFDFFERIFSVLDSYNINGTDFLHNSALSFGNLSKELLAAPYDCGDEVLHVMQYGQHCLKLKDSKHDYPILHRLYDELIRSLKEGDRYVFPLYNDARIYIDRCQDLAKSSQRYDSIPHLFCVWVFAYYLLLSIRHYINTASDISKGRFPSNLIHDGSDEVEQEFQKFGVTKSSSHVRHNSDHDSDYIKMGLKSINASGHADTGSASRFFYSAKASKRERQGSKHPTVKPISLMRYLCRLITPPNGLILDMFAGSGTTGEAAMLEGFDSILIEQCAEYIEDINRRLKTQSK